MSIATKTARLLSALALAAGMSLAMAQEADAQGRRHGGGHNAHRGHGGGHHAGRHHGGGRHAHRHHRHRHYAHRHHHHRHWYRGYPYYGFGFGLGFGSLAYRDPFIYDYVPPRAYYVPPAAYTVVEPPAPVPADPPYPPVPAYQPPPVPGITGQSDGAGSDQAATSPMAAVTADPAAWPLP